MNRYNFLKSLLSESQIVVRPTQAASHVTILSEEESPAFVPAGATIVARLLNISRVILLFPCWCWELQVLVIAPHDLRRSWIMWSFFGLPRGPKLAPVTAGSSPPAEKHGNIVTLLLLFSHQHAKCTMIGWIKLDRILSQGGCYHSPVRGNLVVPRRQHTWEKHYAAVWCWQKCCRNRWRSRNDRGGLLADWHIHRLSRGDIRRNREMDKEEEGRGGTCGVSCCGCVFIESFSS